MTDIIRPLKPTKSSLPKNFWCFDTETAGLYGNCLLVCCISNKNEKKVFLGEDSPEHFIDWIYKNKRKFRGHHFFAHNLEFDLSKIFGNILKKEEFNVLLAGSRLISAKIRLRKDKKEYITFRDTFNLLPNSLADIGEMLGYEKYKMPEKFKSGNLKVEDINEEDIKYCLRDCEVVQNFIYRYGDLLKPYGVKLRLTVAANAKAIWNRVYLKDILFINSKSDELFRKAYYGGRVEVFKSRYEDKKLFHYDINSLYPYVMKNSFFPDPNTLRPIRDYNIRHFYDILSEKEGMAEITFKIDDMNIPLLPYRSNNKLIFPEGKIRGFYCFPEIRFALEHGYRIKEIHRIIAGKRIESPFKDFIEIFKKIKETSEDKTEIAWAKRIMNTLYGKFAQRIPKDDLFYHDKEKIPKGLIFKEINGLFQLYKPETIRSRGTVVSWAAYVTSYGKIELFRYLDDSAYYCDTDSVFREKKLPKYMVHDKAFGKMKLEHIIDESIFVDPKKYAYRSKHKKKVIIKGIRRDELKNIELKDFLDTLVFEYEKPYKLKSSLRNNEIPYHAQKVKKVLIPQLQPKRIFDEFGNSRPIYID
jgi:hypothetical protein